MAAWRMSGGEFGMLVLETVLRIRREFASGKAIKAIARDLRLSRKVVRKAIREPDAEFAYRRVATRRQSFRRPNMIWLRRPPVRCGFGFCTGACRNGQARSGISDRGCTA